MFRNVRMRREFQLRLKQLTRPCQASDQLPCTIQLFDVVEIVKGLCLDRRSRLLCMSTESRLKIMSTVHVDSIVLQHIRSASCFRHAYFANAEQENYGRHYDDSTDYESKQ